jgi:hypothetical protein
LRIFYEARRREKITSSGTRSEREREREQEEKEEGSEGFEEVVG